MVDRRVVDEWVTKADEDFKFASAVLDEGNVFFAQICFHFQQAAEKYLKAFLIFHDKELRNIHSLKHLLKLYCRIDKTLVELDRACVLLEGYYIETRYPVHWPSSFTKVDANNAKDAAGEIAGGITARLYKDVSSLSQ